jgi:predicted TIM-barrel fold metal-dependent hydrolase
MTEIDSVVTRTNNRDISRAILVDAHAHVFRRHLPLAPGGLVVPTYDFGTESYLAELDAHGVAFAVLAAPSFYGTYNDYLLGEIRGRRRLRGTVIVEPSIDPHILRAMNDDGATGARLSFRTLGLLPDLGSWEWQCFFHRLADLDWHVHLHIEGQRLPEVLPAIQRTPVKLVIDHFGRPDPSMGERCYGFQEMLRAIDNGRVWVKLSGGFRIGCDPAVLARRLMEVAGPARLVWGSDCPWASFENTVTYASVLEAFETWVPNAKDRATIAKTAMVLYGFT